MKILKQLLFTFAIVVGLSLTAFAQKDKPIKKPEPPVVNPGKPQPPREKPPEGDKPKKPNTIFAKNENEFVMTIV